MTESPAPQTGPVVLRTRVYFDPDTGAILNVHQVASAEPLDDARLDEESAAFEAYLEQRHGRRLDSVDVDAERIAAAVAPSVTLRVDPATRELVTESG